MIPATATPNVMTEMTAVAIKAAAERHAAILLPVGVIENHGPHLPVGTDAFIALALCQATQRFAGALGKETLIAPPFYWGVNSVLKDFVGSFKMRPETSAAVLTDIIDSLSADGFRDIYVVSHHGDRAHNVVVLDVLQRAHKRGLSGARWLYAPKRWQIFDRLGQTGKEPVWVPWEYTPALEDFKVTGIFGIHADEYETAAMVRYFPDTVDYDALRGLEPTRLTMDDFVAWRSGGEAAKRLTPDGYLGAPNPIDPDLWRHYEETARIMAKAIAAP